jgi:basic membrane protein A
MIPRSRFLRKQEAAFLQRRPSVIGFVGCSGSHEIEAVESPLIMLDTTGTTTVSTQPLKVGMLLGFGGLGDKSFNDSAYAGLEAAHKKYGIEFETIALLQKWAEADYDLIIALGYHNGPALARVAESFPQKRFAIIDTEVKGENVWSGVFRECEADYVVGALAALIAGKEGRVGFIGGVRTPIVRRIEAAFCQGIESVHPDIVLNTIYVDKFDDEVIGQYFAEILYAQGADVIYQAAGRSGIGAIRAAKKFGKLIISTGGDHSELAPAVVLTSRIKNMHRPVLDVIESVVEGQFEGGKTVSYGLANDGQSLAPIRPEVVKRLLEQLPPDVTLGDLITRMKKVTEAATSGQIVVEFDESGETIPEE